MTAKHSLGGKTPIVRNDDALDRARLAVLKRILVNWRNTSIALAIIAATAGLWDMHVHLSALTAASLPLLIANGVGGVPDMGRDLGEIQQWRRGRPSRALVDSVISSLPAELRIDDADCR